MSVRRPSWKRSSLLFDDANLQKRKENCEMVSTHNVCIGDQLAAFDHFDRKGVAIPDHDIYNLLHVCSDHQNLVAGKCLVSLIICNKVDAISLFGDHLIRFFSGYGCLQDAHAVFCKIAKPTVYTWQAIISSYVILGEGEMALTLYASMQKSGVSPNVFIFSSVFKACTSLSLLHQGKVLHDQMLRCGLKVDLALGNALLDMYAKLGDVGAAQIVFDSLPERDVVSWTTMIAGFVQLGFAIAALQWFSRMQEKGILPNRITLVCIVKACSAASLLQQGRIIHDKIMRRGFDMGVTMTNMLIDFYVKCKCLREAKLLFNSLQKRDAVSWGALMSGYAQHGQDHLVFECFYEILSKGIQPNEFIFICALKVASKLEALREGQEIHDVLLGHKLEQDTQVGNALVDMYSKCGCLDDAHCVFIKVELKSETSWGAIMSGFTQQGDSGRALEIFQELHSKGFKANNFILSCALKACGSKGHFVQGKLIHFQIIASSMEADAVVGNAIVDMYAKCGSVFEARKVFNNLTFRNTTTWGTMIIGYTQNGFGTLAIELFEKMQQDGACPNDIIISAILKACGSVKAIIEGERIYDLIMRAGHDSNLVLTNALIAMYVQCHCLPEAQRVFDILPYRDNVSWGTIVTGYAECSLNVFALLLFGRMMKEGFKANEVVFLGVLRACASVGALKQGKLVHDTIVQAGLDTDKLISSTIVDMYSKCGSLQDTYNVFEGMAERDGVTWGIMSAACAHHGNWGLSRHYLEGMQQRSLELPRILCSSMLSAFSRVGHVSEAQEFFQLIPVENALAPCNEYDNCMVDILGRAGFLEEAKSVLRTVPVAPNAIGYTSLLDSCKTHGEVDVARACADKVAWLHPNTAAVYALMSNLYSESHLMKAVSNVQDLRACLNAWKKPGLAWINVEGTIHEFCVGDRGSSNRETICLLLKRLLGASKVEGFVPNLESSAGSECMPEDVSEHLNSSMFLSKLKSTALPNLLSAIRWSFCTFFCWSTVCAWVHARLRTSMYMHAQTCVSEQCICALCVHLLFLSTPWDACVCVIPTRSSLGIRKCWIRAKRKEIMPLKNCKTNSINSQVCSIYYNFL
ncbi:hypothetical protein GOP47_0010009 [Adiantum capillus-veneris]|uniref:Pentatricopeptide repeat-containing protein n=1 Tax=Adiantum capillus-veneris TaxID=13818 RepID=A0A9D4UYI2_ADICA|nr:hypothetical protein GOP47_0010009 [Adiantum capillus-veneris]